MDLENFNPLEVDSKTASLGTLVRGIVEAEKDKNIYLEIVKENPGRAITDVDTQKSVESLLEQYNSKLDEFYQELGNKERSYNSYKEPTIFGGHKSSF